MPLKHNTETFLIFLLGLLIALTGIVVPTLPGLPAGMLPWLIVLIVTLIYPIVLYPLLKANRADYAFRLLHFLPAFLVALWFVIELLILRVPKTASIQRWYTWASMAPVIFLSLFLLALFCLHVIRRRIPRIVLLLAIFVPFLVYGVASETSLSGPSRLASALWKGDWWNISGTGTRKPIAEVPPNLSTSSSPEEEAWRQKLRNFRTSSRTLQSGSALSLPSTRGGTSISSAKPPRLPKSGLGIDMGIVSMIAAYCAVLHKRARSRALASQA